MMFSQAFMVNSLPLTNISLSECPPMFTSVWTFLRLYMHDLGWCPFKESDIISNYEHCKPHHNHRSISLRLTVLSIGTIPHVILQLMYRLAHTHYNLDYNRPEIVLRNKNKSSRPHLLNWLTFWTVPTTGVSNCGTCYQRTFDGQPQHSSLRRIWAWYAADQNC